MFFPLVGDLTCFRRLKRRHKGFKSNLLKSTVTNMPAEGRSAEEELKHIFQYCDANKLSININKANFIVITSSKRGEREIRLIRIIKQKKPY